MSIFDDLKPFLRDPQGLKDFGTGVKRAYDESVGRLSKSLIDSQRELKKQTQVSQQMGKYTQDSENRLRAIRRAADSGNKEEARRLGKQNMQIATDYKRAADVNLQQSNLKTKQGQRDVVAGGMKTALAATGAYAGLPAIAGTALIGGGLSAGFAKLSGQNPYEAAGYGVASAPIYAGLNKVTSPIIDPIVDAIGKASPVLPRVMRGIAHGTLNVAEDVLLDTKLPTQDQAVMSFVIGALTSPMIKYDPNNSFLKVLDDGKVKVNKKYFRDMKGRFASESELVQVVKKTDDWLNQPIKVIDKARGETYEIPRYAVIKSTLKDQSGHIDFSAKIGKDADPNLKVDIEDMRARGIPESEIKAATESYEQGKFKPEPVTTKGFKTENVFEQKVMQASKLDHISEIMAEADQRMVRLENYLDKKGLSLESVITDKEAGVVNTETKLVDEWFRIFKQRAEADGIKVGELDNYFTHITKEKALDILTKPPKPSSFGSLLDDPYFSHTRKGVLKDYDKSKLAMLAYAKESMKNVGLEPEVKVEIKLAQEIRDIASKIAPKEVEGSIKTTDSKLSITEKVGKLKREGKLKPKNETLYNDFDPKNSMFRWVDDRASVENSSPRFYNNFLWPFKQSEIEVSRYKGMIESLDQDNLYEAFRRDAYHIPKEKFLALPRENVINRLIAMKYSEHKTNATNTFMSNLKDATFERTGMNELVDDIFDEYVVRPLKAKSLAEKTMQFIRQTTSRGTIGLNVTSAINNVFETKRSLSLIDRKNYRKGLEILQNSDIPMTQKYGIDSTVGTNTFRMLDTRGKIKSAINKFDGFLFKMFDVTERAKDEMMLAGFEAQGLSKGLEGKKLDKFVIQKFDKYAIKYGAGQDVKLFKNPLVKTLLQYGHYFFKDSVILADKLKEAKVDKGARSYLSKYIAMTVAQGFAMQQAIGMIGFGNTTSTPLDVLQDVKDKEIPFLSPFSQLLINAGALAFDKDSSEYDQEKRKEEIEKIGKIMTIPGANQLLNKTGKFLTDQKRGYYETSSGNVAGPVSDSPIDTAKGVLFGRSYDPKRQEYIDRFKKGESPALSKSQSEVFKSLPKDEAEEYYDAKQESRKEERELKKMVSEGKLPTISVKNDRDQFEAIVKEKLKVGVKVKDSDIQSYYLDESFNMPASNRYEKALRDDEVWGAINRIEGNEDIPQEQKSMLVAVAAGELGLKPEHIAYKQVAKQKVANKTLFVLDRLDGAESARDVLTTIISGRIQVDGDMLVSDGVIDNLVDEGIISKSEGSDLKKIKLSSDGRVIKSGRLKKSTRSALKVRGVRKFKSSPIRVSSRKRSAVDISL